MILSAAQNELAVCASSLSADLDRSGFSLFRALAPGSSTIEVAQALGTVINIHDLLPSSGILAVQSLRPRNTNEVGLNQYSGNFGLGAFPLHTDLAHWASPPHYFLLRCVVGSSKVLTHLLPWTPIVDFLGASELRKAVFAIRNRKLGYSGLVRAMSDDDGIKVLRWDSIFLRPVNRQAQALASAMRHSTWNRETIAILLNQPGDTLIVDNWRMLHGRGEVMPEDRGRHIDRAYISEVVR